MTFQNKLKLSSNILPVMITCLASSAVILPMQAQAQVFTPSSGTPACQVIGNLGDTSSSNTVYNSAGVPLANQSAPLSAGDFVVYSNALTAGYNPAATVDVVLEVLSINLNSAVPPASTGTDEVTINGGGTLSIRDAVDTADSYVTYRLIPMVSGSVTSNIASGTVFPVSDAVFAQLDIDSTSRNSSDVGGVLISELSGISNAYFTDVVELGFQNGGGPAGFATVTATPSSLSPLSWDGVSGGSPLQHFIELEYPTFTGGTYIHGFTGFRGPASTPNRGAEPGICGTILEPELTTTKTAATPVENADGSVSVTYTVNLENTGGQILTGIELTDDLDMIFSGAYDGFIPSTAATSTGGVTALDASAAIITDTGAVIGTLSTNSAFDGGTDTNLFAANTASLDPGDEISVSYTIHVEPNTTGAPVDFTNSVNITAMDAFGFETTASGTSSSVTIGGASPSLSMTKVADSPGPFTVSDVVTYTYTVTNDGDTIIRDVGINDAHNGSDPAPIPGSETLLTDNGTLGDSMDAVADGSWDVLAPGDVVTFTGTYTVTAADAANL